MTNGGFNTNLAAGAFSSADQQVVTLGGTAAAPWPERRLRRRQQERRSRLRLLGFAAGVHRQPVTAVPRRPRPQRGAGFLLIVFHSREAVMNRATSLALILLATTAILPATAQESGGLRLRSNQAATLQQIEADSGRGCALSSTSVTVGVNKAFGTGALATPAARHGLRVGQARPDAGLWSARRWRPGSILRWAAARRPASRSLCRASAGRWPRRPSPAGRT